MLQFTTTEKRKHNKVSYVKRFIVSFAIVIPIIALAQIGESSAHSKEKMSESVSLESTTKNNPKTTMSVRSQTLINNSAHGSFMADNKTNYIHENIASGDQINTISETPKSFADSELEKVKATIEKHIRAVEGSEHFIKSNNNTEGVIMAISMMDATASVIQEGFNTGNKEVISLTKKLKKMAITSQEVNLPKLRAIYGNFLKEKLGEQNFTVTVSGKKKNVLSFTGYAFADNKNIKMFHDNLSAMLHLTRFKQSLFKLIFQLKIIF